VFSGVFRFLCHKMRHKFRDFSGGTLFCLFLAENENKKNAPKG
jgi:hypothetical protein